MHRAVCWNRLGSLSLGLCQVDPDTIIIHQLPTQAGRIEKNWQRNHADEQVHIRWQEPDTLPPGVPTERRGEHGNIIERSMRQRRGAWR